MAKKKKELEVVAEEQQLEPSETETPEVKGEPVITFTHGVHKGRTLTVGEEVSKVGMLRIPTRTITLAHDAELDGLVKMSIDIAGQYSSGTTSQENAKEIRPILAAAKAQQQRMQEQITQQRQTFKKPCEKGC